MEKSLNLIFVALTKASELGQLNPTEKKDIQKQEAQSYSLFDVIWTRRTDGIHFTSAESGKGAVVGSTVGMMEWQVLAEVTNTNTNSLPGSINISNHFVYLFYPPNILIVMYQPPQSEL